MKTCKAVPLYFAAREYGDKPAGGVERGPGPGPGVTVDGTGFVRVMMETLVGTWAEGKRLG